MPNVFSKVAWMGDQLYNNIKLVSLLSTFFVISYCKSRLILFLYNIAIENKLSLWYKSFWLQIQRSRVRFPALMDFLRNRGGLERGPLSLVGTIEELLEGKSSGSGLENRD
jgi:hypothetical protein